jgi:2-iminobutanoate/2-iminopropanoate deaminase
MRRFRGICTLLALGLLIGVTAIGDGQEPKEKKGRGKAAGKGGGGRQVGDKLFLSGAGSFSYRYRGLVPTGMESAAYQAMLNLQERLEQAGYGRDDVVATEVWLTDLSKFQDMNRGYRPYFLKDPPTRTTVQVATLPPDGKTALAEIALVAEKGAKKIIVPEGASKSAAPFSPGILVGDTLYISGQASIDPKTGKPIEGDFKAHVTQTLKNIEAILAAAGMDFSNVVMARVYLTDSENFQQMNEVYNTFVKEPRPARVPIGVKSLPGGVPVEITMIAKREHGKPILPEGMKPSPNYSRGLLVGNELYISGVGSTKETVEEQVTDCLDRVKQIVEAAGMAMSDVVEGRVYLTDIKDYQPMNKVYGPYFRGGAPTRAAMVVPHLPNKNKIMMHFLAAREQK